MRGLAIALPLLMFTAVPSFASRPVAVAVAARDTAVRNACAKASGLAGAAASAPVHFSDRNGQDVVLVSGRSAQRALKGKAVTMLCLYDRRARRAEAQDAGAWSKPAR